MQPPPAVGSEGSASHDDHWAPPKVPTYFPPYAPPSWGPFGPHPFGHPHHQHHQHHHHHHHHHHIHHHLHQHPHAYRHDFNAGGGRTDAPPMVVGWRGRGVGGYPGLQPAPKQNAFSVNQQATRPFKGPTPPTGLGGEPYFVATAPGGAPRASTTSQDQSASTVPGAAVKGGVVAASADAMVTGGAAASTVPAKKEYPPEAPPPHLGGGMGYNRVQPKPKLLATGGPGTLNETELMNETRALLFEPSVFECDRPADPSRICTIRYALARPKQALLPMRPKG